MTPVPLKLAINPLLDSSFSLPLNSFPGSCVEKWGCLPIPCDTDMANLGYTPDVFLVVKTEKYSSWHNINR